MTHAAKNEAITDIELEAAVGGRTQVTKEQYEQILAQRQADAQKAQNPWWKFW